jgi:hypothetical protein
MTEEFRIGVTIFVPAAVQVHWNSYCVEVTANNKKIKSLAKTELPAPLTPSLVGMHALLDPSVMTSYFDALIANGDIDSAQALLYEHLACRPYFESAGSLVHVESLVTKLFWAAYHRLDMLTAVSIWEYLQSKGTNPFTGHLLRFQISYLKSMLSSHRVGFFGSLIVCLVLYSLLARRSSWCCLPTKRLTGPN